MTALSASLATPITNSLRPVPASTRQRSATAAVPKLRYIVGTLMGIFAILAVQLMLSIAVSGGAYEIASLKGEMRQTEQKRQMVAEDINALVAPDTLAGLAASMGMVTDNNPAYLRLSDAAVVGEALPAGAGSGAQVYPVTSGTETITPPAIISAVFESVTAPSTPEESDTPAQPVLENAEVSVAPASVSLEPAPRAGGTIPSPTTR
jgi:hypothetical protein